MVKTSTTSSSWKTQLVGIKKTCNSHGTKKKSPMKNSRNGCNCHQDVQSRNQKQRKRGWTIMNSTHKEPAMVEAKTVLSLIRAFADGKEDRFKDIAVDWAYKLEQNGQSELAQYILAQFGMIPTFSTGEIETEDSKIDDRILEVLHTAKTQTKSGDRLVHICWLIQGLDIHQRSGGKMGHSLEKTQQYVISNILRMPKSKQ